MCFFFFSFRPPFVIVFWVFFGREPKNTSVDLGLPVFPRPPFFCRIFDLNTNGRPLEPDLSAFQTRPIIHDQQVRLAPGSCFHGRHSHRKKTNYFMAKTKHRVELGDSRYYYYCQLPECAAAAAAAPAPPGSLRTACQRPTGPLPTPLPRQCRRGGVCAVPGFWRVGTGASAGAGPRHEGGGGRRIYKCTAAVNL
jgi:hypothetical protein